MWSKMSETKKRNHLAKLDSSCKKKRKVFVDPQDPDKQPSTSGIQAVGCNSIGQFDDYNFPEFVRGSWTNANKIVVQGGVGPFPNDDNKRTVISLKSSTVHTVEIRTAGWRFSCDEQCPRFKYCGICAHTVAVAFELGKLQELSNTYKVPLSRIVQSGKKDNERARKRKKADHPP